jgi:hypothetical protein
LSGEWRCPTTSQWIIGGKPIVDVNIATLQPIQIAQAKSECLYAGLRLRVVFGERQGNSYAAHSISPLGVRLDRPGQRLALR